MADQTAAVEYGTTVTASRRHIGIDMASCRDLATYDLPGRLGGVRCGSFAIEVIGDQDWLDYIFGQHGLKAPRIMDLPLCKACERVAGRG